MKRENAKTPSKGSSYYVYVISFIAAAGGFNWGYDIVLMSGAILYLKNAFNIDSLSVQVSSLNLSSSWIEGFTMTSAIYGILIGMLVGGNIADRLGRKRTLILAAFLLIISAIGTTLPDTLAVWNIFRIVGGFGGGMAALVSPMYISEIAPAGRRGALVSFNQMAIVVGCFVANVSTYFIGKYFGSDPESWRWMFGSACIPITIFLFGLFFVPDTPRWLLLKGRVEEARNVLIKVGGSAHAEDQIREIEENLRQDVGSYRELIRPGIRIAMVVAIGLGLFQQLAGVSTLIYYAPTIFVKAGISSNVDAIGTPSSSVSAISCGRCSRSSWLTSLAVAPFCWSGPSDRGGAIPDGIMFP